MYSLSGYVPRVARNVLKRLQQKTEPQFGDEVPFQCPELCIRFILRVVTLFSSEHIHGITDNDILVIEFAAINLGNAQDLGVREVVAQLYEQAYERFS